MPKYHSDAGFMMTPRGESYLEDLYRREGSGSLSGPQVRDKNILFHLSPSNYEFDPEMYEVVKSTPAGHYELTEGVIDASGDERDISKRLSRLVRKGYITYIPGGGPSGSDICPGY